MLHTCTIGQGGLDVKTKVRKGNLSQFFAMLCYLQVAVLFSGVISRNHGDDNQVVLGRKEDVGLYLQLSLPTRGRKADCGRVVIVRGVCCLG